jgi:hypothetical protein
MLFEKFSKKRKEHLVRGNDENLSWFFHREFLVDIPKSPYGTILSDWLRTKAAINAYSPSYHRKRRI